MYVCMHVCMYARMHVCTFVVLRMSVCTYDTYKFSNRKQTTRLIFTIKMDVK
jgi:hypothetical protein